MTVDLDVTADDLLGLVDVTGQQGLSGGADRDLDGTAQFREFVEDLVELFMENVAHGSQT